MKLRDQEASGNVEGRRGMRMVVGGGQGGGGILVVLISYFLGFDLCMAIGWTPHR